LFVVFPMTVSFQSIDCNKQGGQCLSHVGTEGTILVPITSNTRFQNEATQIALDPATAEVKQTGLLRPSAVKCENVATVETRLVRRKIGVLPPAIVVKLDVALKSALDLS
jgi:mRNA-degrading endonuclease toxin of MazEF toxin-antitoxin module